MESSGGPVLQRGPSVSAKKLRRAMRAVYVVLVKQHQPKLAALGVQLHRMFSGDRHRRGLSCRAMDPATAVVHPLPRGHRLRPSGHTGGAGSLSSLSCRSMDPAAAVRQYQYRPREVQFSCKSTPLHKRRRAQRRAMRLQQHDQGRDHSSSETEYYGSAAAVTRLFALMDVEEEAADVVVEFDDGDLDLEAAAAWPALTSASPAPGQVRITDSPFHVREEDDEVDRRADEFITWFHEQLRTQQQRPAVKERGAYYWVR